MDLQHGKARGQRTIDAEEARARGHVHVDAGRAVELDRVDAGEVAPAAGNELARGAVDARAGPKVVRVVLCVHLLQALPRDDEPLVDEPVEHLSGRLDDRHVWHSVRFLLCERLSAERARAVIGERHGPASTSRTISIASL